MRDATSYQVIAPYYDWIMAHVDYDAWGRYLRRVWRKLGPERGPSGSTGVLELGAGTCPFERRNVFPAGTRTVYTDLSPFMLSQGRDTPEGGPRVAANALSLPFRAGREDGRGGAAGFQLCLMVYDAFNYLMREDDVASCLREVKRVLAPGGLFIFDVTTESNSRKHFHQALDFGEMAGCTYMRESGYDKETRVQRNDFTFFVEGEKGCWRRLRECHQQRIYKLDKVKGLARRAGFALAGCYEGFTFQPGRESSERVHFALRKP